MKSIFLSPEQVFDQPLPLFEKVGTAAPASDLALLTVPDDGFVHGRRRLCGSLRPAKSLHSLCI